MKILSKLGAFLGVLSLVAAIPSTAMAATSSNYEAFNEYQYVAGLNGSRRAVQLTADSTAPGTAGSNIVLKDLVGSNITDLTELSTTYNVVTGDCNGGSPRFYTQVKDATGQTATIVYYISYNLPCTDGEQMSGNVASSESVIQVEGQILTSFNGKTFGELTADPLADGVTITEVGLVTDNVSSSENGQVIVFDNVVTTGTKQYSYNFEPKSGKATAKEQCKNGGWQEFGSTYKNQGQCVSATENIKTKTQPSSSTVFDKVRSFLGL